MKLPEIVELSKELSNLIAAGEVVERPQSVVKELVENAIDANALDIKIDLESSGLKKIIITDNGFGMRADQIPTAVKAHATSKIKSSADLFSISTLGFRGEALSSIASVSKMTIISNPLDSAYRMVFVGGEKVEEGVCAFPKGTKIEVSNLFYNTPARFKHLGSEALELSHITTLINRIALANPHIKFTLTNNGKILYQTDGLGDMFFLIGKTYGTDVAAHTIEFSAENSLYQIHGFTTTNNVFRSNKNAINIVINNRIIRNLNLIYAVTDAYKSIIPVGKYPITVLYIDADPSLIDVNVHPSKLEIRFTDETQLRNLISKTIGAAIYDQELVYKAKANEVGNESVFSPTLEEEKKISYAPKEMDFNAFKKIGFTDLKEEENLNDLWDAFTTKKLEKQNENIEISNLDNAENNNQKNLNNNLTTLNSWDDFLESVEEKPIEKVEEEKVTNNENEEKEIYQQLSIDLKNPLFSSLRYIGQFNRTYLLFEIETDLYLIDQHAAMERIRYEEIVNALNNESFTQTELLIPITIDFSVGDMPIILSKLEELKALGIIAESFGSTTLIFRAIPTWIPTTLIKEYLSDIINHLISNRNVSRAIMNDSLAKQMACKSSIKANMNILNEEVSTLIENLGKCKMPYTCPHGRPTLVKLSLYEIEKLFKRVL